jgi:hypothetical protein
MFPPLYRNGQCFTVVLTTARTITLVPFGAFATGVTFVAFQGIAKVFQHPDFVERDNATGTGFNRLFRTLVNPKHIPHFGIGSAECLKHHYGFAFVTFDGVPFFAFDSFNEHLISFLSHPQDNKNLPNCQAKFA